MCTAGQRVSLTITGPGPSFVLSWRRLVRIAALTTKILVRAIQPGTSYQYTTKALSSWILRAECLTIGRGKSLSRWTEKAHENFLMDNQLKKREQREP